MKVIIIKDCKDGKVNDIVDVSDGYAKNFLIRNGFANAINSQTSAQRDKNVKENQEAAAASLANAQKVKETIEGITLQFKLKVTNDVIHGHVTRKQIVHGLKEKKVTVGNHAVENVKIASLGVSRVAVTLHKQVVAQLKVEVSNG